MTSLVTAATNLVKNPKPASLVNILYGGGAAAPLLVYDQSYSGETSIKCSLSSSGNYYNWITNGAAAFGHTPITGVSQLFSSKLRFLVTSGGSVSLQLIIVYTDGTSNYGSSSVVSLTPGVHWVPYSTQPGTAISTKSISYVGTVIGWISGTPSFYIGGHDVRAGGNVDSFVVGDGPHMRWSGTANASTSIRDEYVPALQVKRGAQVRYTTTYYVVNKKNVIVDDITKYVDASPSINIDMLGEATKGTLSINLSRNDLVLPFRDLWISPRLTIEHPDGTLEGGTGREGMLGIYSVEPASERYDATRNSFQYQGYDLLWLLQQETILPTPGSSTFDVPTGSAYLADSSRPFRELLKLVFEDAGFTEANGMLYLPPHTGLPAYVFASEVGIPRLDFITELCDAMAWHRPWVTFQAQMTSEPIRDLATREPDVVFESGPTSPVRWPFEIDPEPEDMANRVRVFGKRQGFRNTVSVVAENRDPAHPFSYTNLGRWIDAPQMDVSVVANEATALSLGAAELAKRGMLPYTARLRTRTMIRQLNEVYGLNLTDAQGDPIQNGQGKYWCIGQQITLGPPWEMTHSLKRVIPIFETGYAPEPIQHGVPVPVYTQQALQAANQALRDLIKEAKKPKSQGGVEVTAKEQKAIKEARKLRNQIAAGLKRGDTIWTPT